MALKKFNPTAVPFGAPRQATKAWKVLYVEDEDTNWEVAEFALRSKYALDRASTAEEAFASIQKTKYDLILMDIQLSGSKLNGIEIVEILKNRYKGTPPSFARDVRAEGTPIVFVTAYTARYSKETLRQSGGDDLIAKPVNFTRLSLVITRLLARAVTQQKL